MLNCADCASRKSHGRHPCAPMQTSVPSRPFDRYILVVGDYFSKWTEAFPLQNQEAHSIAKTLTEEWVCRFGATRSIHSDQGRNFESTHFKELCRLLNIHKSRTSPYHLQSDGLIERFNRTLLSMLSLFVEDNQLNWDSLLPYVMLAYRTSAHASTSFTPYKVLFGQEIVLPVDVMLNVGENRAFSSVDEYVTRLQETLSSVVDAVRRHQAHATAQQKASYDFGANFQYFSEGELVWVHNKARKRGVCSKLQRRFKGPFRVLERITEESRNSFTRARQNCAITLPRHSFSTK
uniref:Integrase catalytic domain-containing protein n=1 Tax=Oryzias melastigma TaxID=30732 RepID=A0A3B3C356_ORYME